MVAVVVGGADLDLSTGRGKFHRVTNQVPKDLLNPHRVRPDMGLFRREVGFDLQFLFRDGGLRNLNCFPGGRIRVHAIEVKVDRALRHARQVE
jgi:hypothetical protein